MERKGMIGGSDAAAILGLSPWKSPYALWEEKTGNGEPEQNSEGRDRVLQRGKRLEPVVMEMLQDEYDIIVTNRNARYVHPGYPFLSCEIDFEYGISWDGDTPSETGNGDVKTVHPFAAKDWGEQGTDEIPVYYVVQFQFGMMVNGAKVCCVAALIGADDLRVYYVPRDEEIITMLRERCVAFWENNVLAGVPPPVTTSEDAARSLRRFNGATVAATDEVRAAIAKLKEAKAQIKVIEAEKEAAELVIQTALTLPVDTSQENKFAIVDDAGKPLATWNPQSTSRISAKLVKELHPEIVSEVTETSTFRVLRVK